MKSSSFVKNDFIVGTKVKIINVGNDPLNNATGEILGKSFINVVDHYIVMLDDPLPNAKAITITEACLIKID